jgi:hypothetical protein
LTCFAVHLIAFPFSNLRLVDAAKASAADQVKRDPAENWLMA